MRDRGLAMRENEAGGRLLWFSNQLAGAGGPLTRSTTKAVRASYDPSTHNILDVPLVYVVRGPMFHDHVKRQVEIAIVQRPIPADTDLVATHKSRYSFRVKRIGEEFHIFIQAAFLF